MLEKADRTLVAIDGDKVYVYDGTFHAIMPSSGNTTKTRGYISITSPLYSRT